MTVGYVDANHGISEDQTPFDLELVDQIGSHSLNVNPSPGDFSQRILLSGADLAIVNGNHFRGDQQIVCLDEQKAESLGRKADRLTNVIGFIAINHNDIPDFVREAVPAWEALPVLQLDDIPSILELVHKHCPPAPLKGLILAGGKSTRMGRDKGLLDFHGKSQREYLADLASPLVDEVFISCREDQVHEISSYPTIVDRVKDMGPFGAIMSAFMHDPNSAWLVLACDLPNFDRGMIAQLVENRAPAEAATSFRSPQSGFPEPLAAIWEPKSYARLLSFLGMGYSCPRKVLINSDVKLLEPSAPEKLANVNSPEDLDLVKK